MSTIETLEQGYKICSKLTIEIPERRQWHLSGAFIVNFEHISYLALVFLLLTLSSKYRLGHREIVSFQLHVPCCSNTIKQNSDDLLLLALI